MNIVRTRTACRKAVALAKKRGASIGFVPTMGALHAGHMALVRRAQAETDFVVVSIFVNPKQFGPQEDLRAYPRPFAADSAMLAAAGVDVLFHPSAQEMYPRGFSTWVDERVVSKGLCGNSRPGHFQGVCTVVAKLFMIVQPDYAYFGRKDFQQVRVIQRMVRDLDFTVAIREVGIVRQDDGIALSSRNAYLSRDERAQAVCVPQALARARRDIANGQRSAAGIVRSMRAYIRAYQGVRIEYIAIINAHTLEPVTLIRGAVAIVLAVFVGRTRLIDNCLIQRAG